MISFLILGGVLAAAAGAVILLIAEVAGSGQAPHWTATLIAAGLCTSALGWVMQWLARRLQKFWRRRCIQCGREAVKGSIYCGPHLREAATLQRDRTELDRL